MGRPPAALDASINRTDAGWRVDTYHAGTDEVARSWVGEHWATAEEALDVVRRRLAGRLARVWVDDDEVAA